jgi:cytochrome c oxidase subunit 2
LRVHVRPLRARSAVALGLITAAAVLLPAASAFAGVIAPEGGGSPNADGIRQLYLIILALGAIVFFGVGGLFLYTIFKYRARKGAVPAQIHGNTRLEIGWTLGAALLLVIIAVVTFVKLPSIEDPPNSSANGLPLSAQTVSFAPKNSRQNLPPDGKSLAIDVNGQQYIWRYIYPDGDNNNLNNVFSYQEMVVPTNTTVTLSIRSQDVAHSWWIPKLGGKFDAIPGYTNYTWFKISRPGLYTGQCAELCGRNHANMTAQVRAVTPAQYQAWYARQQANILSADKFAAAERTALNVAATKLDAKAKAQQAALNAGTTGAAPIKGAPGAAVADAAAGKMLFVAGNPSTGALACGACHTLKAAGTAGQTGPNLDTGLAGRPASFILSSIVDPSKDITKGYADHIMPNTYGTTLTKQQVASLVAFINNSVHGK